MPRKHTIWNTEKQKQEDIPFTQAEEDVRDTEESAELAAKPTREWQSEIQAINISDDLENIIGALDAPTRARIAPETIDKYNAKKLLRAQKP